MEERAANIGLRRKPEAKNMKISQVVRRDIVDVIRVESVNWSGRLEEPEFLARLFNLSSLPSTDGRFEDAAGDIWQHRVNNYDWDDDWVFYDRRFNLLNSDDIVMMRYFYVFCAKRSIP